MGRLNKKYYVQVMNCKWVDLSVSAVNSLMIVRLVRVWMQWTCGSLPHFMRQLPSRVLRCAPCCWPMAQTLTWSTAIPSPSLMLHPLGNCRNASNVRTTLSVWTYPVYVPSCLSERIQCMYLLVCVNASSVCTFLFVSLLHTSAVMRAVRGGFS